LMRSNWGRASSVLSGFGEECSEGMIGVPGKPGVTAQSWQQEVRALSDFMAAAEKQDARVNASYVVIDGNKAFGVEFTEGDVESPLIIVEMVQAVERKFNEFADAHAGGAEE
jgi:hypothetical protein